MRYDDVVRVGRVTRTLRGCYEETAAVEFSPIWSRFDVRLVGGDLTALLTQFRSYRAFKDKEYIVNIKDLMEINSRSSVVGP